MSRGQKSYLNSPKNGVIAIFGCCIMSGALLFELLPGTVIGFTMMILG